MNLRAVDLAREERLAKADDCISKFEKIEKSSGYIKSLNGERSQELKD